MAPARLIDREDSVLQRPSWPAALAYLRRGCLAGRAALNPELELGRGFDEDLGSWACSS